MELPRELQAAIEAEIAPIQGKRLAQQASLLSARYRAGAKPTDQRLVRSEEDVAAYAASRLPATFAAVAACLAAVRELQPGFRPETFMDVGAGPGTAMWAALSTWPGISRCTLLERDERMIAFGKRLAGKSAADALRGAQWLRADAAGGWEMPGQNLVVASYMIGEMSPKAASAVISRFWGVTDGVLLLVEPGTPAGFARIRSARAQLIADGAYVLAPCPHAGTCPMQGSDWCHFAARVSRSRVHRQAKGGALSYEDEKFSYVALSRQQGTPIEGRVLRHPLARSGHIHLRLCTPQGISDTVVSRRERERFAQARDLRWGSAISGQAEDEQR